MEPNAHAFAQMPHPLQKSRSMATGAHVVAGPATSARVSVVLELGSMAEA